MALETTHPRDFGGFPLLVTFMGAPTVWALHLAASYFLVALDCESDWDGAQAGVLLATVFCAVAAAGAGAVGWRAWKRSRQPKDGDLLDPPQVREFLVLSGAILAALFTGVIILGGMAPLFLPMCS